MKDTNLCIKLTSLERCLHYLMITPRKLQVGFVHILWLSVCVCVCVRVCSILFYPITLEGRRGTTDEFATIHFHLVLFSAALIELAKSIPVNSLILSTHLFFCLPLFPFPFTVPCRVVLRYWHF